MPSLDYVESETIYSRFRRKQGSSLWAKIEVQSFFSSWQSGEHREDSVMDA